MLRPPIVTASEGMGIVPEVKLFVDVNACMLYDSEGSDRGSLYSSIIRYSIVVLGYRNGEIPGDYSPRTFKLPRLQALIDSKKALP